MKRPTKIRVLTEALTVCGGNPAAAFEQVKDMIGEKPLVWTFNPVKNGEPKGTPRRPHSMVTQMRLCMEDLERLAKKIGVANTDPSAAPTGNGGTGEPTSEPTSGEPTNGPSPEERMDTLTTEHDMTLSAIEAAEATLTETRENMSEIDEEIAEAINNYLNDKTPENRETWSTAEDKRAQAEQTESALVEEIEHTLPDRLVEIDEEMTAIQEEITANTPGIEDEIKRYLSECARLRDFVEERDLEPFDSMRIEEDGLKALTQGFTETQVLSGEAVNGLLASIGAAWDVDTREQAGISDYDYMLFGGPEGSHRVSEYVLALIRSDIPVYLYGPAGTGKSSACRWAAEQMSLDYYEVNLAGSLASAVTGKHTMDGFIEAEFCKAYEFGGVMCLEELDMAHPQVVGAINNAIANGHYHNPTNGISIKRHEDFHVVANGNTLMTGATHEHNARVKLDGASLDRFRLGRVQVKRDDMLMSYIIQSHLTKAGITL